MDYKWMIGTIIAVLSLIFGVPSFIVSCGDPKLKCSIGLSSECGLTKVELTVSDSDTAQPLQDVRVQFESKGAPEPQYTDANGYAKIKIPESDEVRVVLSKEGYASKPYIINSKIDPNVIRKFKIEKEMNTEGNSENIEIIIIVLTQEREPIEGAKVHFIDVPDTEITDSNGHTNITVKRRDEIEVKLTKDGFKPVLRKIDLRNISGTKEEKFYLEQIKGDSFPIETLPENSHRHSDNPTSNYLRQEEVVQVFNSFIDAWNNRDYSRQTSYLSYDFESVSYDNGCIHDGPQNYDDYLARKATVFRSGSVTVKASNIQYIPVGNEAIIRYYQNYSHPSYESWGTNDIYFRKNNGKVEIFKEMFNLDGCKKCNRKCQRDSS